ncbi:DUF4345 domain-containing protein [Motiliproteus sp. SC1-56]|uniref:DUF4345 domain-containing protein n=1 Tax=Motiliproteus sp. SC1-56 TaxID=2799565 RepID=UPI001A8E076C|nr:DUF4345 domain-containing protein [Motiliproteus sp. SC1-56]
MRRWHRRLLRLGLLLLGLSLVQPGLLGVLFPVDYGGGLLAPDATALGHLRGLNGMMAGLGLAALWCAWRLPRAGILALGGLLALVVLARLVGWAVDGTPDTASRLYLGVEVVLSVLFLLWPPPVSGPRA